MRETIAGGIWWKKCEERRMEIEQEHVERGGIGAGAGEEGAGDDAIPVMLAAYIDNIDEADSSAALNAAWAAGGQEEDFMFMMKESAETILELLKFMIM